MIWTRDGWPLGHRPNRKLVDKDKNGDFRTFSSPQIATTPLDGSENSIRHGAALALA
jgi:hypothetical protein